MKEAVDDLKWSAMEWLEGAVDQVKSGARQAEGMASGSVNEVSLGALSVACMSLADPLSGLLGEATRAFGTRRSSQECEKLLQSPLSP